jgi:plastocyanin
LAAPLVILLACGGAAQTGAPATDQPGATQVTVATFAFDPQSVTVAAGTGVTWTNNDSAAHTVTFTGGPDLGQFGTGDSVSRSFDSAGEFDYVCTIHPGMAGTVVVQ